MALRKEGWESDLQEYIADVALQKFEWGKMDCLIFVSDACKLLCGIDPMSKAKKGDPDTIRGRYATKETAYLLIKKYRGSIPKIMDIHFDRISPFFGQRGDVAMAKIDGGNSFGIVMGGDVFFKMENQGFLTKKIDKSMIVWRVE